MSHRSRLVLVGATTVLPDGVRDDVAVVVEGATIADVVPATDLPDGAGDHHVVDLGGRLLTAGLVDAHVHGAAGDTFDAATPRSAASDGVAAVPAVLRYLAAQGVTSAQASLVSDRVPRLVERVEGIADWADALPDDAAELLGVHLEGPFLAAAQCGAHDPAALIAPGREDVRRLLDVADALGMITLAPELPGAAEATAAFADAGVVVAAGHSEATGEHLREAVDHGLTHLTHLWSGQSSTVRRGPWRVPGLLEESLASTGLTAEVIADGRHLPPTLLEIARRCLPDELIVVSDGTAGTGMPRGFGYDLAAVRCEVGDGVGVVVGADAFAGSTSALPRMLAHLHGDLGWPLADTVAMATARPAAVLGVAHRKGSIAVGHDADLAVFDPGFTPWATVLRGRWLPGPDAPTLRRTT